MTRASKSSGQIALVVHPDLGVLSRFQESFSRGGIITLLARDLPTALLAIAENEITVAVISWRIGEPGDGWALGAALRRAFPSAFVVVLAAETSVPTLQQAINRGFDQLYEESYPAEKVAADILSRPSAPRLVN